MSTRMARPCVFLCLALFFALSAARGQSVDDVHVVPRSFPKADTAPREPEIVPAEPGGHLYAQSRPLRVNVDLVLVPVTVTDAKQQPITTLGQNDFTLYEDGKPRPIRYFSLEAEPISIAVLFDVSRSMTNKVDVERAALVEFFRNADPRDEYFAIAFSNRPKLLAASTESIDDLQDKLTTIVPGGPTAMLDAIYMAQAQLRTAKYKRRAILIITDGGDNASRYSMREIKRLAQESDVEIYAIGLFETFFFNTFEEYMGKKWLRGITDRTGGRTVTVESREKLPALAAQVSREMRSRYILGYTPTAEPLHRWKNLRVEVKSPAPGRPFRAHFKNGYYAGD
jgi:Ca-activated chloride channel homolog